MKLRSPALLFAFVALVFLSGCVTREQLSQADYGKPPENAQAMARAYLADTLKDPESARVEFGPLMKGWSKDGLIMGGTTHFGWVQVLEVNAKNSFGAYTGKKTRYLMFKDGRFFRDITDSLELAGMSGVVR